MTTIWTRIATRLPAPGILNFIAGLLAGAGINLLTSAAVGDGGGLGTLIVLDSLAWVTGAALLTGAATLLQNAEREVAVLDSPTLPDNVRQATRRDEMTKVARRVALLALGALLSVVAAVILLPRLTD